MGYIQSAHTGVGLAFSIIGLTLVVPICFLFKQYLRFLDHIQLVFLYWMILAPTYDVFGAHLGDSWSQFIPNFLTFCTAGDLVCTVGYALSFTICLVGAIFLIFLIVTFEKCRKPDLRIEPAYSVFKGLFRWTYIPLIYYSLYYLISNIKNGINSDFIAPVVILAWTILFPLVQLLVYTIIQQENDQIWIKWFQFLSYFRIASIVIIFVLGQQFQGSDLPISKYFVYGPLVLYALLYIWKGVFVYKIFQRVLFGLGEAVAIVIFSLYLFDRDDLNAYDLDFIGLGIILVLDIILYTVRLISWLVYGKVDAEKINPQQVENEKEKNRIDRNIEVVDITDDFKLKKKNKYDQSDDLQNSRDSLVTSVRKGAQRRKR